MFAQNKTCVNFNKQTRLRVLKTYSILGYFISCNFRLIEKLFHKKEMTQETRKVMTENKIIQYLSWFFKQNVQPLYNYWRKYLFADDLALKKAKKVMTTANA